MWKALIDMHKESNLNAVATSAIVYDTVTRKIYAYTTSESPHKIKTEVIIDSRATEHMASNRSWFQTYHVLNPQILVAFGNDSGVKAIRIGTIVFESEVSGK